jgi:hypothetical protein
MSLSRRQMMNVNDGQQLETLNNDILNNDERIGMGVEELISQSNQDVLMNQQYRRYVYTAELILSMPDEPRELKDTEEVLGVFPEPYDASRYLEMITEVSNYRKNALPIYQLELMVPDQLRKRIISSSTKSYDKRLRVYLKITRIFTLQPDGTDDTAANPDLQVATEDEVMWKSFELRPYNPGHSLDQTSLRQDDVKPQFRLVLDCFAVNDMLGSKTCRSAVYENTNVTGAIVAQMTKYYDDGREFLILAPPENSFEYEDIIIPPMTIFESMRWLQEAYGIYESGILCFSGRRGVYVLPSGGAGIHQPLPYEPVDGLLFYIVDAANPTTGYGTYHKYSEYTPKELLEIHYLIPASAVNTEPRDDTTRELSGETVKVVSSNIDVRDIKMASILAVKPTNTESDAEAIQQNDPRRKKERVFHDRYGNKFGLSRLQADATLRAQMLVITLDNIDSDHIQPNLTIKVIFQNPVHNALHGGTYMLMSKTLVFQPPNAPGNYEPSTQIELRRVSHLAE